MLERQLVNNQRIGRGIEGGDDALQKFAQRSKEDSEMSTQDSIMNNFRCPMMLYPKLDSVIYELRWFGLPNRYNFKSLEPRIQKNSEQHQHSSLDVH